MTAIISTTYDDRYLWFLPLTTWALNKLGVDVVCFMPYRNTSGDRFMLVSDTLVKINAKGVIYNFDCPEHKEATYAQCSRLYGAAIEELHGEETLIVSDIDMLVFNRDYFIKAADGIIDVYGADLVPPLQYPMCYLVGNVKTWRSLIGSGTYQEHLDRLLGGIDCENMRGNFWSKDQEEIYRLLQFDDNVDYRLHNRAKPGTQFADNRVDRDDANWRSYLNDNLIDAHLWRPGYTDENFANIMELMTTMYPNDNFSWLVEYNEKYKQLL